jgi:hypothetical protein
MLGVGKNQAYQAVKAVQIPHIRIGHRVLAPTVAIERMLSGETMLADHTASDVRREQ